MKPKKRQKLCYNCEGDVDLDVIVCPFCAADLREEKPELTRGAYNFSSHSVKPLNTEQSLYPPPYGRQVLQEGPPEPQQLKEEPIVSQEEVVESSWKEKIGRSGFTALFLFTLGVQLFLLGVLLVILSDRGVMILQWNASLWFLYIFASIPLLLFGYRYLNKL